MSRFVKVRLVIPLESLDAANRLASIFDFDVGGGGTFGGCPMSATGSPPATHCMAFTAIKPEYLNTLIDPQTAMAALTQLSQKYGRDAPQQADVDAFCAAVLVGEQHELVRIVDEPAA